MSDRDALMRALADAVAEQIAGSFGGEKMPNGSWSARFDGPMDITIDAKHTVEFFLSAIASNGYAVVPREATEDMLMAANGKPTAFEAWPAMVASSDLASPSNTKQEA